MTKKMKRLFSVMLIVSVMMSMLSVSAFAEDTVPETSFFQCEYAAEHTHTGSQFNLAINNSPVFVGFVSHLSNVIYFLMTREQEDSSSTPAAKVMLFRSSS